MKKYLIIFFILFICLLCLSFWQNGPFRYIIQGQSELKRDQIANAVQTFETGVKKFPDNKKLLFLLSKSYLQLEEIEKANQIVIGQKLHKSLKTNRDFKDFLLDLAEENKRFGNEKLSKELAENYLKYSDINETSTRVVKNYIRAGILLPEKSLELLEKAYNLASIMNEKELKTSIISVITPKYFEKVEEQVILKNYDEAISLLNKVSLLTDSAQANFEKAKIYCKLSRIELAEKEFEEAITKSSNNNDYKIAYAEALEKAASSTNDPLKRKNYSEKVKLLLADNDGDPKKTSILKKIMNLNANYRIANASLFLKQVGDYNYPTIEFKIQPVTDYALNRYKIIFLNKNKEAIDTYEADISKDKLNTLLAVTSKNPVETNDLVFAKLYINNEFVKEY